MFVSAFCKPETVVGVRRAVQEKKDQFFPGRNEMKAFIQWGTDTDQVITK